MMALIAVIGTLSGMACGYCGARARFLRRAREAEARAAQYDAVLEDWKRQDAKKRQEFKAECEWRRGLLENTFLKRVK